MIRKARHEDALTISQIHERTLISKWSEAMYLSVINDPDAHVFVCVQGFIAFKCMGDSADLLQIAVDVDFQHKGYGQKLLDVGLEALKKSGVDTCFLEVRETNEPALQFYLKNEFMRVGMRKNYYGTDQHAIVMRKDL